MALRIIRPEDAPDGPALTSWFLLVALLCGMFALGFSLQTAGLLFWFQRPAQRPAACIVSGCLRSLAPLLAGARDNPFASVRRKDGVR